MNRSQWRAQGAEEALDPGLPIVDAHHHLWIETPDERFEAFGPETLIGEKTGCGHNVIATVYVDSHSNYLTDGPEHLRVAGEVAFAGAVAAEAKARGGAAKGACAAIVGMADLCLGAKVGEVLDAQIAAAPQFRGIRHKTALDPDMPPVYGGRAYGEMASAAFREGFAELARRDLAFDAWMFHPQLPDLLDLARAFPEARIVLDHCGGPIGTGRFAGRLAERFGGWIVDMAAIALCPNVFLKLGGLNMGYTALDASELPAPRGSAEVAAIHRELMLPAIDLFGPERCMFESNFPVDMYAIGYTPLWNSFKRIAEGFGAAEKARLFHGTAMEFYRIDPAETAL